MNPRADYRHRSAFTFVELTILLVLIFVLLALTFASLARAKQSTRGSTCANNMGQLMSAIHKYGADHNDYLPHPNWGLYNRFAGWLCNPPFQLPETNIQTGLLWPYTGSYAVYRCPLDPTNSATFAHRKQKYTSYIMNGAACFFENQTTPQTAVISSLRPDVILFWQADERNFRDFNDGASRPDEGPTRLHSGGTTIGVIDGSAAEMKHPEFNSEVLRRPSRLWWNQKRKDGPAKRQRYETIGVFASFVAGSHSLLRSKRPR